MAAAPAAVKTLLGRFDELQFFTGVAYKALRPHYKLIISGFQGVPL
jgi:hypothetical protein